MAPKKVDNNCKAELHTLMYVIPRFDHQDEFANLLALA